VKKKKFRSKKKQFLYAEDLFFVISKKKDLNFKRPFPLIIIHHLLTKLKDQLLSVFIWFILFFLQFFKETFSSGISVVKRYFKRITND
jgi:hypothetical protein